MGSDLSKNGADFADVATKLREKIQAAFVDLIPQEHWDEMLKREVEKFMSPGERRDPYNGRVTEQLPSPFSAICQAHLNEMIRQEVAKRFEAMDRTEMTARVAAWIEANHQAVLDQFIRNLVSNGIQEITGRLSYDIATMAQTFLQNHGR